MCGIAGILRSSGQAVHSEEIKRMNEMIKYRGPDGDGIYLDQEIGLLKKRISDLERLRSEIAGDAKGV